MFSANSSQVSDDKLFVEDVFSTWLYTGTGSAQTITNGIDLSGKGGMVWSKARTQVYSEGNCIADETVLQIRYAERGTINLPAQTMDMILVVLRRLTQTAFL